MPIFFISAHYHDLLKKLHLLDEIRFSCAETLQFRLQNIGFLEKIRNLTAIYGNFGTNFLPTHFLEGLNAEKTHHTGHKNGGRTL